MGSHIMGSIAVSCESSPQHAVIPVQVIAREKDDLDAKFDRALLYAEVNEPKKAVQAFESILDKRPGDPEVSC